MTRHSSGTGFGSHFHSCVHTYSCGSVARPAIFPRASQGRRTPCLQGMPVKQILQQQRGEKGYLFLRRADENAFAIVDVTNAAKPVLLDRNALPEPTGGNISLPPSGSALAIAFVPDRRSGSTAAASAPGAANLPTETVRLIDLSDPRHPNMVRTFEGVTSVAIDDSRKLVFLANNGGLWIVSHRELTLPLCSIPEPELDIYRCQWFLVLGEVQPSPLDIRLMRRNMLSKFLCDGSNRDATVP